MQTELFIKSYFYDLLKVKKKLEICFYCIILFFSEIINLNPKSGK